MNVNISNLDKNREHWASIDGYSNYEVSWFGRVWNMDTGRILKGIADADGYLKVNLSKNGIAKIHYIHQLVAREWVSNPEEKRCVDHMDNDRTNNNWKNLRWATIAENNRNRCKGSNTSSIYKGVSFHKKSNKWVASVKINRKLKH